MAKKRKNSNYKQTAPVNTAAADKRKNRIILLVCISIVAAIVLASVAAAFLIPDKSDIMGTGACAYLETRDIDGRDVKYVEFCVEGYGRFVVLLDATTAPKTVENFVSLVEDGFYDGITFHRIMANFMIQGGDPDGDGRGGSDKNIKGEFANNGHENDISHIYGVISMARSDGTVANNYGYDSASSQFFICNADATGLDGQYAAFGYVVEGMSVVDEITADYAKYNGVINNKSEQPVIKYIKMLDAWEKQ